MPNSDLKLKKVGKITRPSRYDLNQIPYNYTVKVTNRFKGLNLIDSAWRTMDGGSWHYIGDRHFAFLYFFFLWMVLTTTSCTRPWTSLHSSSGILSDLISWICLLFPLYNHKGFDLGHTDWPSDFPYCIQFKCEFCHKEFMIWATVSSWSCFCWLYRISPSLPAKNVINLILVLTIWWCPCVESSLVLLEEGVCYDQCIFLAKLY